SASATAGATTPAHPTGTGFRGSSSVLLDHGPGPPAHFALDADSADTAAWHTGPTAGLEAAHTEPTNGPRHHGPALGTNRTGTCLYAANFRQGTIDVFDATFKKVTLGSGGFGTFSDPNLPAGFAPFGIANIGGRLYVSYAKQDAAKHD